MNPIAFNDPRTGNVTVVHPGPDETKTLMELVEFWVPHGVEWQELDPAALPTTRRWRDAWDMAPAGKLEVSLTKARELTKKAVRRDRVAHLSKLDGQQMSAMLLKDDTKAKALESKKQVLRDLPQHIDQLDLATLETIVGPDHHMVEELPPLPPLLPEGVVIQVEAEVQPALLPELQSPHGPTVVQS
jgi:hypothetical protein